MECWTLFVLACRALCSREVSLRQIQLGDALLEFCQRTQHIFGKEVITPNMHMHCHLKSCILDYGPLHSFWVYAFERYNGLLGSMPNNNRSIELQIMRENQVISQILPDECYDDFSPLFPRSDEAVGSLSLADTLMLDDPTLPFVDITFPKHYSRYVLSSTQKDYLRHLYSKMYSTSISALDLSSIYFKYSSIVVNGNVLGSNNSKSSSSSIVMSYWDDRLFGMSHSTAESTSGSRATRIDFLCKHVVNVNTIKCLVL